MAENKAAFPGFVGPSYQGRSRRFDNQRCVNMYCEIDESAGAGTSTPGKNQQNMVLIGTPGLEYLQTIGSGPIRCVYTLSNLELTMIVSGNQVFQLSGVNAIPVPLAGNLNTSSGPVQAADNGVQVLFVDGQYGYYQTIGAGAGSIETFGTLTGGTGYAPASGSNYYTSVPLTGGTGTGATADITVTNGSVSNVTIINPGSGYVNGDTVSANPLFDDVGGGSGFLIVVATVATGPFLTVITDPNFYPADTVTFQDGYFILNQNGTTDFFISDLYSIDFLPLNQEAKTGNSDILIGVISVNRQLYLLGARTVEMWWDQGASGSSPFARQDGRFSQQGLAAPASLAVLGENFYWLSSNAQGGGIVMGLVSGMPQRISTHAIENIIQNAGLLSEATAYSYQQEGHYYYVLNVPGTNTTLVYDTSTQLWHERQSTINGVIGRHLGQYHAVLNDIHIVGDYTNGNIYQYNLDYYLDNGQPLYRIRQTPHVAVNSNNVFFSLMDVDFQFGVGLVNNGSNTQANVYPTCVLQISRDGGETFGNPIKGTLGPIGAFRTRCRFARCGYGRDLVFKLTVTDAVEFQMLSAMCDIEAGDL
jgi:hypothetical protein